MQSNSNFSDWAKTFERVSQPRCFDGDGDVGGDVEIDGVNQEDVKEGLVIFQRAAVECRRLSALAAVAASSVAEPSAAAFAQPHQCRQGHLQQGSESCCPRLRHLSCWTQPLR